MYSAFVAWGTLNSRLATSPVLRLAEREEKCSILSQNWDGNESNRTFTCMVLKATDNDRRTIQPFAMMNFVGLDLAHADQGLGDDRGWSPLSSGCIRFVDGIGEDALRCQRFPERSKIRPHNNLRLQVFLKCVVHIHKEADSQLIMSQTMIDGVSNRELLSPYPFDTFAILQTKE
ncbi:hypothetical protein TNCV_1782041 [Trichonephila clavipes]|nr:hypothetical protein TNCV_1782041 [Trichonephila clavipes]